LHDSHSATLPRSKYLAIQFDTLEQQRESASLGMWVFLATEIMFFGALFTGYTVYRNLYPQAWIDASRAMKFWFGTINTAILICSSLTMALGVHAAHTGARKLLVMFLLFTILLGGVFLGIKAVEYTAEYHEHHIPGHNFHFPEGTDPRHSEIFFSLYFIMTGIHALHITVGLLVAAVITYLAWRGHYAPEYYTPVENFGLYWHFVDVIWIFLYPLLYLVGHRPH
jgi:cytochrome c oxidase subunit 3